MYKSVVLMGIALVMKHAVENLYKETKVHKAVLLVHFIVQDIL